VGILGLTGFALTGLSFSIAWRMDSTQGFHAIMSMLLMPMWLLSGAFFPARGLATWLEWVLRLNPLSYGVTALRQALGMEGFGPSLPWSLAVTAVFALAMFALALRLAGRPAAGDLR
jgi:ABC-2 type transport system permease protein